jgi:dATP pyrophosphohydrolase
MKIGTLILYVISEYAFPVQVTGGPTLSPEHSDFRWCEASKARELLKYDSNKIALWELCERMKAHGNSIPDLKRF